MKKLYMLWAFLFAVQVGYATPSDPTFLEEEEALSLRRIADFWQEGETSIAKVEMEKFIKTFPKSPFSDRLLATLGDLALKEKNYLKALEYYDHIEDPEHLESSFLNRLHALFYLGSYEEILKACRPFLENEKTAEEPLDYFLSVSLYQLALQTDPPSQELLKKAEPFFERALQKEETKELKLALAHLYSLIEEEEKAAHLYTSLEEEPYLFQAALCQAKYDKNLALETFEKLSNPETEKGKSAFFNWLILSFDLRHFEQILEKKSEISTSCPPTFLDKARLIIAKSHLKVEEVNEAIEELQIFLTEKPQDSLYKEVLTTLLDAAYQIEHIGYFDEALEKLEQEFPEDSEIPKALFSKAQMIKKEGKAEEALLCLKKLVKEHKEFIQKPQALFEIAHLEYQKEDWESAKEYASLFLEEFPEHELSSFVWRYLAASLTKNPSVELKKIELLEKLTEKEELFTPKELLQCRFYLAKVYFELQLYEKSMGVLTQLLEDPSFEEKANAKLLISLCHRDGRRDDLSFVKQAEIALAEKADLIDVGALHASLFNSYMKLEEMHPEFLTKKEDHLFQAFENGFPIEEKNFFWLVDTYFAQMEQELPYANKVCFLLESKMQALDFEKPEEVLKVEEWIYRLAKTYQFLNQEEKEVSLLKKLHALQKQEREFTWKKERETAFLLGEALLALHAPLEAEPFFEEVNQEKRTLHLNFAALALLQEAKLKIDRYKKESVAQEDPKWAAILSNLKSLVLQKFLPNEPIHLEAALEYIELQSFLHNSEAKRLEILEKTKRDFEETDSLIGRDYLEAKAAFREKAELVQNYLQYLEAEILLSQALLEKEEKFYIKAKDLLEKLTDETVNVQLKDRAAKRLEMLR